ncbi:MAG: DinB family protein [Pyrinomonadaceae bacterium]
MDERIKQVTDDMSAIAEDARQVFGSLSAEQINWKPAEKSWSVGQCLDHLIKTNDAFGPEMTKIAAGGRKNSFIENWSPFTGYFGRFLIKAVGDDSKKVKAPSQAIVPPSDIASDIVARFEENIAAANESVKACEGVNRQKTVITSPFLAIMTYTLEDGFTVLVEHTKRHIRQAKRVMEAGGFPK